jgi:ribonuclease-3
LRQLTDQLGYQFKDGALLAQALTHRSASALNNERLEFLGDAILGFVIAAALYRQHPNRPEGMLSRLRANLVNRESLATMAGELRLGEHLKLGPGELKSGGARRKSILADALEALIGAVYLDSDVVTAKALILRLFNERLTNLPAADALKDPKTRLQEYLQARGLALPEYAIVNVAGADHRQTFAVRCRIAALKLEAMGEATSRRRAEQAAAAELLDRLNESS